MVFSDLFFLFAFIPTFALCYLLGYMADSGVGKRGGGKNVKMTFRNAVLVLFSLVFYAWGEPVYVFLMIGSVVVNYVAGLFIDGAGKYRKAALTVGIAIDLSVLGVFKYAGFFCSILRSVGIPVGDPGISLPIGISFYIFQSISYLVDVYRRVSPGQKRFVDLLLYISMFPQLIAGPIVRYGTVAEEILHRSVFLQDVKDGVWRFILGLGKKVILSNQLSELSTQFLGGGVGELSNLSTLGAWTGILAFTLQIYFDFSGYSDMAIGMGRCMGFHFRENFDHPYISRSLTEFWRRWHMSLGSFFRDYVYIPLGGNRRHQPLNILIVWFLTGMWHGASWNFILWGLYFGIIVMVEKYTLLCWKDRIPSFLLHLYSLLLIVIGWGLFYFEDFPSLGVFFRALFGAGAKEGAGDFIALSALRDNFFLWIAAIILSLPVGDAIRVWTIKLVGAQKGGAILEAGRLVLSLAILLLSCALLVGATNNAFIYTRF